ncbi:NAD(P)-dependent alcohol dehydrogenase [Yoonia sp.]|uniref:NAD(P)-dependent alcohol dehydrogenase n=1 Tax=Yoonia sp. TaxID=2212373 RepID=UPI0039758C5F
MKAYVYKRYGPPEVLRQVTLPCPKPGETDVLVRIHAATVCSADWPLRSLTMPPGIGWMGRPAIGFFGPRKPVRGTEFAGTIAAVGAGDSQFKAGDQVLGFPGAALGAHAQYISMLSNGKILHKPANLSFAQAAALLFGAATAYDYLVNRGRVQSGEHIPINGANGSVGLTCVQIALLAGAQVTAVCSQRNRAFLRQLGVQETIDYHTTDFASRGRTYDVVVDTVGTAPWRRCSKVLRHGGHMLLISGKASDMLLGPLKARLAGKSLISGVAHELREILQDVVAMAASAALMPVIDREYPFGQMIEAHRYVDSGRKRGAVVIRMLDEVASGSKTRLDTAE